MRKHTKTHNTDTHTRAQHGSNGFHLAASWENQKWNKTSIVCSYQLHVWWLNVQWRQMKEQMTAGACLALSVACCLWCVACHHTSIVCALLRHLSSVACCLLSVIFRLSSLSVIDRLFVICQLLLLLLSVICRLCSALSSFNCHIDLSLYCVCYLFYDVCSKLIIFLCYTNVRMIIIYCMICVASWRIKCHLALRICFTPQFETTPEPLKKTLQNSTISSICCQENSLNFKAFLYNQMYKISANILKSMQKNILNSLKSLPECLNLVNFRRRYSKGPFARLFATSSTPIPYYFLDLQEWALRTIISLLFW